MERYDEVLATFSPQRSDDLKPHARAWVGVRMRWCAGWIVEPGESAAYEGQWAMTPMDYRQHPRLEVLGWAPLCDLAEVEPIGASGEKRPPNV